jgi:hypothetical protein
MMLENQRFEDLLEIFSKKILGEFSFSASANTGGEA